MIDNRALYTVKSCVDYFMNSWEIPDVYFIKWLDIGLWGLRELTFDVSAEIKTFLGTLPTNKTLELPTDYISWNKVGTPFGESVKTIGVNEELQAQVWVDEPNHVPTSVDAAFSELPNGIDASNYGGYFFYNFSGKNLFGFGGGVPYKGFFKEIVVNNRPFLQFTSKYGHSQAYVEYLSDGFTPTEETILHPYKMDYLRAVLEHEREKRLPKKERSESSIARTGREVSDASRKVTARLESFDQQTALNTYRKYYRLTVKA